LLHAGAVIGLAFSPDGRRFAVATEGDFAVRLYETATREAQGSPLEHPGPIWCLAFSPDGRLLATGCADTQARLWDLDTGLRLGPPLKCRSGVRAVAFSPDGETLLTAETDKVVRRWSLPPLPQNGSERVVAWTRVLTGMRLDKQGAAHPLSGPEWEKAQHDLTNLGGPPVPPVRPEDQSYWHRREADECLATRQWSAARWHLDRLL